MEYSNTRKTLLDRFTERYREENRKARQDFLNKHQDRNEFLDEENKKERLAFFKEHTK